MSSYQDWILSREGHIANLTLNRPRVKNSMTDTTLSELRAISDVLAGDRDTWVVILRGQGRHFSAGVDLGLIQSFLDQSEEDGRTGLAQMQQCLDVFEALPKPTIACLQGFVIGGGLVLALCCDFRVASASTIFSLPEIKLGIPVLLGTQRLSRIAGIAVAKEMILLGERFGADHALAEGLVHRIVPDEELDTAVAALAEKFLALPPRTVSVAKRLIMEGYSIPFAQSQALELEAHAHLRSSPDVREAIASYLAKRPPTFTGE